MEADKDKFDVKESDAGNRVKFAIDDDLTPLADQVVQSSEIVEESVTVQNLRRQHLAIQIPASSEEFVRINIPPTPSQTPKRVNFSPLHASNYYKFDESESPSSSRGKSSVKKLIPRLSFKFRNRNADIEKAAILALGGSVSGTREKSSISRTFSFPKLFTPRTKNAASLPATPIAHSNPESVHGRNPTDKGGIQRHIHRSRSVPALDKDGNIRQVDTLGVFFRVIPTTPRVEKETGARLDTNPMVDADGSDNQEGEDIAEEEAVCRICFVELGEGGDTLKMECDCKGELALAHQECAVKWFSIKGNKICEVCKQDVKNLPVTLLRIQNPQGSNLQRNATVPAEAARYRVWQDVPVLVIVSMLAYFCFLEQLLVNKMGSSAIAVSLPFSCILGLLASMTSTTMVRRRYAWIYATIQFALVVLFAHIFFSLLHVQGVLSVLLATFAGFGGVMCGTSIIYEFLKWRIRWRDWSNRQRSQEPAQPQRPLESAQTPQPETHPQPNVQELTQPQPLPLPALQTTLTSSPVIGYVI